MKKYSTAIPLTSDTKSKILYDDKFMQLHVYMWKIDGYHFIHVKGMSQ